MLLYLCFLLLPALAQATCNETLIVQFFDSIDANGNGYITRQETDAILQAFDGDRDGIVTNEEAREGADQGFADDVVDEIFRFLDINGDGYVTAEDEDLIFEKTDTDLNGILSRDEYTRFIRERCQTDYYK